MKHKLPQHILLILAVLLINACNSQQPVINELSNTTSTIDEIVHINNCGNKAESSQTSSRSFATKISGTASLKGEVKGIVEGGVSATYEQYKNTTKTQILTAAAGTNMEFVLRWSENVRAGNATVNGQSVEYTVNIPVAVEQVSSRDLGCNGGTSFPPNNGTYYDAFEDSAYNGSINQALWSPNAGEGMSARQENGKLVLQASNPGDYGMLWINPTSGLETSLQTFNLMQATFSWEPNMENVLYLGLTVEERWNETGQVSYICDFVLSTKSSTFHCTGTNGTDTSTSRFILVQPGQVYTLRIEADPATALFSAYLNESLIDTYQPPNADVWRNGAISYNLHMGSDPQSTGTSYIDDVVFGKK